MSITKSSLECASGYQVNPVVNHSELQEICVHKWKLYDQEISLLRKSNRLECLIVDETKKTNWRVPFEGDTHSIQQQIDYLLQCYPVVNEDGSIDFLNPIIKWPVISIRKEVKLLRKQNELIWQMFDGTVNIRSQSFTPSIQYHKIYFREGDVRAPKYRLAEESVKAFEQVNSSCIEDRIAFLRDCQLQDITISFVYPNIGVVSSRPHLTVGTEPIVKESVVDARVLVSRFKWSVTLVCYRGSEGNHAEILVEGVKNGDYFLKVCHFTGITGKEILDDEIVPKNLKYEHRTEIWKRSSEKVKKMLEAIQVDKANPPRLNLWGCDSIFSDGSHNCFTWAREKLEILDIHLGKSRLGFLFTRSKNYTYPITSEGLQERIPIPDDYNIV